MSLVFCLLGSAIAVSIYKISNDPTVGAAEIGHYINATRALGIVSAILLSVVIAFTCGTAIMYLSRLIFTFRYIALFRRYGSLWCGASLDGHRLRFAVFKGLKNALRDNTFLDFVDHHLALALLICWAGCTLLLFIVQRMKINILRITILSGTFAPRPRFRGQRPGELHRRAGRRLRRLRHRTRGRAAPRCSWRRSTRTFRPTSSSCWRRAP